MTRTRLLLVGLLALVLPLAACQQDNPPIPNTPARSPVGTPWADKVVDGAVQIEWKDLMPPGGNPKTLYDKVAHQSLLTVENDDPFSKAIVAAAHAVSSRPPVVASLDGLRIRMSGLVLPLEGDGNTMTEFLLVPYYGACIHVPPPPSNQTVYVTTGKHRVNQYHLYAPVWVTGVLHTEYEHNNTGDSGYTLHAEKVVPYE